MNIVGGIINGILFLHSANLIHRDLKLDNIMLDSSMNPRISDFGASFQKPIKAIDKMTEQFMETRLRSESSDSLLSKAEDTDSPPPSPQSPQQKVHEEKKKRVSRRLSMWNTRAGLGTPTYMSPELIPIPIGKKLTFSRASDVFAFGVILWYVYDRIKASL